MIRRFHRPWTAMLMLAAVGCTNAPVVPVGDPPKAEPSVPLGSEAGPVIAFALGGGAARGFAHVGVLNVLERNGIHADIVVGTSAGSVVGALYSAGLRGPRLEQEALRLERERLTDFSFPDRGFIRGEGLQRYVNEAVGGIELQDLPIRFAAVATDLYSGELVVFNVGNTGMAVRASSSFPGVVQPVKIEGREYVDGGLVSQVPVRVARSLGADIVIAVDVSRLPAETDHIESTLDVLHQSILIMSMSVVERDVRGADVLIRPTVGDIRVADFSAREHAIEAGERAAQKMLPDIRAAIARVRSTVRR